MQRALSLGMFGIFGRSAELRELDKALRAVDLHPNLVPEAIKLTVVKLMREPDGADPPLSAYGEAAAMVAYCMVGAEAFAAGNGAGLAAQIEERIDAALDEGEGLDAKLLLLMLHARVMQPSVVETFQLESSGGD
ncbi:MAG TPA: hypothetical protein VNJ31_08870 [Methyloceanibacter sp.]|nr:hypothetical protein [Methyloceanibacter sp.]